jgi:hypothetical protein
MSSRTACRVAALVAFASSVPAATLAQSINPGDDLFHTLPGTYLDFSAEAIPAGFFGPGSLPFDGTVDLAGLPQAYEPCLADPPADTIFMRPIASNPPDAIPVYLAQLSLVSVSPIVVRYESGPDQLWNMAVELAPVPVPPGTMTIRHESADGGTFDLHIPTYPQFRFTSVGGGQVLVHHPSWPLPFSATDVPWRFDVPPPGSCRSNLCVNPQGATVFTSRLGRNVVAAFCPSSVVPAPEDQALSTWGRLKTTYRWEVAQ